MIEREPVARVLRAYPDSCRAQRVEFLGSAGGFSGARFWRMQTERGPLCLHQWPRGQPTPDRLAWIHAVLYHAYRHGFHQLPVPLPTRRGDTFVADAKTLWDLTPWLPGAADYRRAPRRDKLQAALVSLATFHRGVSGFPSCEPGRAVSPSILARKMKLIDLVAGGADRLAAAVRPGIWSAMEERAWRLLEPFNRLAPGVARQLQEAASLVVELGPCLRDIGTDHVLFVGARVSGIVDFGAMRHDSVAADVSRLLGSMAGSDRDAWQQGLAAYESVRPLSEDERTLVAAFDQSGLLMSGLNWVDWIFRRGIRFDNAQAVVERVDWLLARLEREP